MIIKLVQTDKSPAVPLQSLIDVSTSLLKMSRESYRQLSGKKNKKRIPELQIYASNFKNGSIIHELFTVVENVEKDQLVLGIAQLNPSLVLENLKNAITFWKLFAEQKQKGNNVVVNITNSPNTLLAVNGSTITIAEDVYKTAISIHKSGDQLTKPLRNKELASISFENENDLNPLVLDSSNAECFVTPLETDILVKELTGEITEFNKKSSTGKFQYIKDGTIISINFKLMDSELALNTIDSMKKTTCRIFCHEQYIGLPDNKKNVVRVNVIKIEEF